MKIKKNQDGTEELEGTAEELAAYEEERKRQHEKGVSEDKGFRPKRVVGRRILNEEDVRRIAREEAEHCRPVEHHHYPPIVAPDPVWPPVGQPTWIYRDVWVGDPPWLCPNTGGTYTDSTKYDVGGSRTFC